MQCQKPEGNWDFGAVFLVGVGALGVVLPSKRKETGPPPLHPCVSSSDTVSIVCKNRAKYQTRRMEGGLVGPGSEAEQVTGLLTERPSSVTPELNSISAFEGWPGLLITNNANVTSVLNEEGRDGLFWEDDLLPDHFFRRQSSVWCLTEHQMF